MRRTLIAGLMLATAMGGAWGVDPGDVVIGMLNASIIMRRAEKECSFSPLMSKEFYDTAFGMAVASLGLNAAGQIHLADSRIEETIKTKGIVEFCAIAESVDRDMAGK